MSIKTWLLDFGHARTVLPLAALAALCFAWTVQYGLGYAPCELCLMQRLPYEAMVAVGIGGVALSRRPYALAWVAALLAVLPTGECGLALFHVGVEQHWWGGLRGCTAPPFDGTTASLLAAPIIPCDALSWTFLGVSMASWNALYAFALAAYGVTVCLRGFVRK